ncbi:hypothetical protein C8N29_112113 [Agitococcus lubricus]|uniref:Uncharacterized protein n=1 Tax=Agitococcus lubricus TaxID=1077255 RepID=A0A2T5IX36_9GAMM|nr:hypothetical protein C8N29_112113 [Agitococcus lubricus]
MASLGKEHTRLMYQICNGQEKQDSYLGSLS